MMRQSSGFKLASISEDTNSQADHCPELASSLRNFSTAVAGVVKTRYSSFNKGGENIVYYKPFSQEPVKTIILEAESILEKLGGLTVDSGFGEDAPSKFNPLILADHLEHLAQAENSPQFFDFLIMRIRTMLSDPRMISVAGDQEQVSLNGWLERYIGSDDACKGTVSVIDLSLVPQEIVHIVTAVISRLTFEALQRYRRQRPDNKVLPTSLVMEEAHNFIKSYRDDSEEGSASSMCCQVFEKIAREGRKFGLGLVLSSQRPSELSPTVLSQCNTFLLHRITNDRDQEMVARLLPDGLRGLIREIPALPSQHAFLVGWAAELPILTKMLSLSEDLRPASDDPDFWNVWTRMDADKEPVERRVDWQTIASEWQETVESTEGSSEDE